MFSTDTEWKFTEYFEIIANFLNVFFLLLYNAFTKLKGFSNSDTRLQYEYNIHREILFCGC